MQTHRRAQNMPSMSKPAYVFVVEDDPVVRELVLTRLALAGYATGWASDGNTAFNVCKDRRPDAMILDISMPGIDGMEVLRRLQKHHALRPVPTMMLTARNKADDVQQAIALGAMDFMRKPFDDKVLLARVSRLVRAGARAASRQI